MQAADKAESEMDAEQHDVALAVAQDRPSIQDLSECYLHATPRSDRGRGFDFKAETQAGGFGTVPSRGGQRFTTSSTGSA